MRRKQRRFLCTAICGLSLTLPGGSWWEAVGEEVTEGSSVAIAADRSADAAYWDTIHPLLAQHCFDCHATAGDDGPTEPATSPGAEGGLILDRPAGIRQGGDSGPLLVPGDPEQSRLIRALRYTDPDLQMPPDGPLTAEEVGMVADWIAAGAPLPADDRPIEGHRVVDRARQHWAFQPPTPSPILRRLAGLDRGAATELAPTRLGETSDRGCVDLAELVDQHVQQRLAQAGLEPAPPAAPEVQLRRLYYDLTGLPVSYEQLRDYLAAPTESVWQQHVDHLLASPQFAERWARHWLDVARFADTKGYVFQEDRNHPHAFKYRDWVIAAIQDDMHLSQFLELQLAADRLIEGESGEARRHLAAMGFLTLGRRFINNQHDIIDDQIDVVFRGLMGLTVSCARCHDHKYDPISAEDYYRLYGIFASSRQHQEGDLPPYLVDHDGPRRVGVFQRGNPAAQGPLLEPGFLAFLALPWEPPHAGSGRLELARSITRSDNPLTARVFVNRVWGHLFGQGLIRTPSDFGMRSEPSPHQALLDDITLQFQLQGGSLKPLVRSLVMSQTYRRSSHRDEHALRIDADNQLLACFARRRRDLEAMRDAMLLVSGQLDSTVGGPSVAIETPPFSTRRTAYAFIDRQNLPEMFRTFDFANPDTHAPRRWQTSVPQQTLFLLNSPFVMQMAEALVADLQRSENVAIEPPDADPKLGAVMVRELFRRVLARDPREDEIEEALSFVRAVTRDSGASANPAAMHSPWTSDGWRQLAHLLLMCNEFHFVE